MQHFFRIGSVIPINLVWIYYYVCVNGNPSLSKLGFNKLIKKENLNIVESFCNIIVFLYLLFDLFLRQWSLNDWYARWLGCKDDISQRMMRPASVTSQATFQIKAVKAARPLYAPVKTHTRTPEDNDSWYLLYACCF